MISTQKLLIYLENNLPAFTFPLPHLGRNNLCCYYNLPKLKYFRGIVNPSSMQAGQKDIENT